MGGPAGVAHAGGALHGGAAAEKAVQDLQPALGLVDVQAVFPLGEDGNPGGVIPSVLQAGEAVQQNRRRLLCSCVSNDTAHKNTSFIWLVLDGFPSAALWIWRRIECRCPANTGEERK